jgi:hypothetical protein
LWFITKKKKKKKLCLQHTLLSRGWALVCSWHGVGRLACMFAFISYPLGFELPANKLMHQSSHRMFGYENWYFNLPMLVSFTISTLLFME